MSRNRGMGVGYAPNHRKAPEPWRPHEPEVPSLQKRPKALCARCYGLAHRRGERCAGCGKAGT